MTRTRITTDGLADSSVTTAKIAPGAVVEADLAASSVTTSKIASGAVTAAKVTLVPADIGAAPASHTHASTAISDSTSAGRALMTGADAAAQRTSLGLGTMAQATATDYLARAGGTMTGQLVTTAGTASAPGIAVGTSTNGLIQPTTNAVAISTNGVERLRIDSTGQASSVIPSGSTLYPHFMCRAWAAFSLGSGTTSAAASGNVSSTAWVSAGLMNLNFATAMPDVNYAVIGTPQDLTATATRTLTVISKSVGSVQVVHKTNGAVADNGSCSLAIFR
jgi:hypothetical protein